MNYVWTDLELLIVDNLGKPVMTLSPYRSGYIVCVSVCIGKVQLIN